MMIFDLLTVDTLNRLCRTQVSMLHNIISQFAKWSDPSILMKSVSTASHGSRVF
jgi:hypothetical protein